MDTSSIEQFLSFPGYCSDTSGNTEIFLFLSSYKLSRLTVCAISHFITGNMGIPIMIRKRPKLSRLQVTWQLFRNSPILRHT